MTPASPPPQLPNLPVNQFPLSRREPRGGPKIDPSRTRCACHQATSHPRRWPAPRSENPRFPPRNDAPRNAVACPSPRKQNKPRLIARACEAPRVGLEPTTYRLTAGRSTIELTGNRVVLRRGLARHRRDPKHTRRLGRCPVRSAAGFTKGIGTAKAAGLGALPVRLGGSCGFCRGRQSSPKSAFVVAAATIPSHAPAIAGFADCPKTTQPMIKHQTAGGRHPSRQSGL